MITVELQDKKGKKKFSIEVNQNVIAEATMIVYKNVHYSYSGMDGRFFSNVKFRECNEPVTIRETFEDIE